MAENDTDAATFDDDDDDDDDDGDDALMSAGCVLPLAKWSKSFGTSDMTS
jgi:hypothetical protein